MEGEREQVIFESLFSIFLSHTQADAHTQAARAVHVPLISLTVIPSIASTHTHTCTHIHTQICKQESEKSRQNGSLFSLSLAAFLSPFFAEKEE